MNTVMSNASGSGVPFNCQNWLALGVVIFTEIDIDEALQQIGLKTSGDAYLIQKGDRLVQGILVPVGALKLLEVTQLTETARGTGGIGSTGK